MIYLTEREMNAQGYQASKVIEAARRPSHGIRSRKRPVQGRIDTREYALDDIIRYHEYLDSLNPKASEITIPQACKRLKCSKDTIRRLTERGILKVRKAGQKVFIDRYSIKQWEEKNREPDYAEEPDQRVTLADILTWKPWNQSITQDLEVHRG